MIAYQIKKQREKMEEDFGIMLHSIKKFEKDPNRVTKKEALFKIRKFNYTKNMLTGFIRDIMVIEKGDKDEN